MAGATAMIMGPYKFKAAASAAQPVAAGVGLWPHVVPVSMSPPGTGSVYKVWRLGGWQATPIALIKKIPNSDEGTLIFLFSATCRKKRLGRGYPHFLKKISQSASL